MCLRNPLCIYISLITFVPYTNTHIQCDMLNIFADLRVLGFYAHMPIGKVWIYRLLLVCFLFVCTVTDFSGGDKGSSIKFCTMVHRHRGQGISHFGELCYSRSSTEVQNRIYEGVQFVCGLDHTRGLRACRFVQRARHA